MAYNEDKHHDFAAEFMRHLHDGDIHGVGRFLHSINEQDIKMIAATKQDVNAMLFIAATSGNKDMMEFLVKYCQARIEYVRLHKYRSLTPLWCAAANDRLEVVELLLEQGADINAASSTGITLISYACYERRKETVEFLIKQGADIHRPDHRGESCLMKSVGYSKLSEFLIDNGARVNEQDNLGNTALYHAIKRGRLETVQLLLDRGSDQNIKNKLGDDALQYASLRGRELIVKELVARQKPTPSRRIDSLQLLGSYYVLFSTAADNVGRALVSWRRSVKLRIRNPRAELCKVESMPVYMIVKEVNTVEELEELCQDEEMVYMYAIQNLLQILGPGHKETTYGLAIVSKVYFRNRKYGRCFDLLKYALQRLQDCCSPTFCEEYLHLLHILRMPNSDEFQIEFDVVFEILDMVTSKVQLVFLLNSSTTELDISSIMHSIHSILSIIFFLVKLDKSPEQTDIFKQAIHRLVHSQVRDKYDQTLLHCAVQKWYNHPVVAKVLLECGADVNAVDSRHNTALHLISSLYEFPGPYLQKRKSEIIKLLLQYSAHPDIVNERGFFPAFDRSFNMLDHVSLKCLATAVIRDHQIPYVGQIPKSLVSFVQMHGKCPLSIFQYSFPPMQKKYIILHRYIDKDDDQV